MKANKKDFNYLDYIPKKSKFTSSFYNDEGKFIVKLENVGFYNKLAQVIFKRPRFTDIELEEYGTFIWEYIDGENTIYDIALKVKEKFGDKAEPLYDRICQYFVVMADNKLVVLEKDIRKARS